MGRKMIQSKSSEGYELKVPAPEGLNLLDSRKINLIIANSVYEEVRRNCHVFYVREGVMPSVVSVDSSVQSYIRDFLDNMSTSERQEFGELRRKENSYDRLVFIAVRNPDCDDEEDPRYMSSVKVSSECSVGRDFNIKLTYCDEGDVDGDR